MRVLYLESPPGYGGSMQSLIELIEYLPPEVETVVAVPYDPRQYRRVPDRVQLELIQPPQARGFHGYIRLLTQQIGWYRVVRALLCRYRPDVVHFNNHFIGVFGGAIAAQREKVATVSHVRTFTISRHLGRRVNRLYDAHLAISRAVACNLKDQGVPDDKCYVIYDPVVPPDNIHKDESPSRCPKVGILGMLQPWKGQHVFLQGVHLLHERGVCFHAVVAGEEPFGSKGYKTYLQRLIQDYGISSVVNLCGFVADPYPLLADWDVAVHASIEPEPLGRVAIEAMLVGTPVVATDGGGIPEFVEHERTGLLVPMGDAEAMGQAIERLLRDAGLRQRLAEAGRLRAREMFDPHKHAREVMRVYQKVLEKNDR